MQKLFKEVKSLDKRCYEELYLSEDILMEQAAFALANEVKNCAAKDDEILFVCGSGNNGADGIAAARILAKELNVSVYIPFGVKSQMAEKQLKRLRALHVKVVTNIIDADIYVDAIFGSGLVREFSENTSLIIKKINSKNAKKIACDIPSGIDSEGRIPTVCFEADTTITMGALKECLYSDEAKDFTGEIKVANLGISRDNYELKQSSYLLEESDLKLPYRNKQTVNKGDFGHVVVISGHKEGASRLSAIAAFNFGAGLVTLAGKNRNNIPMSLMSSETLPKKFSVLVAGMGLGNIYGDEKLRDFLLSHVKPMVIDADLLHHKIIIEVLNKKEDIVLTPHPKEFQSLLKILDIADISMQEIQDNRFKWVREFSKKYPNVVLVLKGANTLIIQGKKLYVNPLGTSKLAKGGSGDVLAGMIGSLLAQNYTPLEAAMSASIAHSMVAKNIKCSNFGLSPIDLCEGIKWL
ncbi:bifunctional ADP-dependent NAD(P)H-hydrate dehydratase/NAD(P)H-hydrate epimerase [Sulfurospirillum arcachonense]|uniref:bifunctional ADP-dependent NAD(P)H-hydrate dehydratase/NAD(P)H-hydrate epimerase n=1 Tax=Sulfurospirillum arcachonense TaxID=57666 RepID=UPI000468BB8B|nr:bifunctional ADP-dependent NAD(P)H-hydrate dehydratase/NAD(P)H-hydrate epimerase [Sulfurospirillum arcachonense]